MSVPDAALQRAYRRARYRVYLRTGILDLEVDRHDGVLSTLLTEHAAAGAALITACNPGSQPTAAEVNDAAQARLLSHVRSTGYAWCEAEALDPDGTWPAEAGVLILGIDRADALALARDFGQNALLYVDRRAAPELVWTRPPPL